MITARVNGLPDLRIALAGIVPKLRLRALRNALAAGARLVQKQARAVAPVLSPASLAVQKGYRASGTVRKAISVRNSKLARRAGDVGVFVNVKPAAIGNRGAKNPRDPFYWRWLNFGWTPAGGKFRTGALGKRMRRKSVRAGARSARGGVGFLEAGARMLPQALHVFLAKIKPAIEKLNKPRAPAP
jgi:hypothetical protein